MVVPPQTAMALAILCNVLSLQACFPSKSVPPCLFGQAHCKPWQFKTTSDRNLSTLQGSNIGADQLISAQPGLVLQEKGNLTQACIWVTTVFVDYYTCFIYVALMTDQTVELTLEAKHAFEHFAFTRDVTFKHYHG